MTEPLWAEPRGRKRRRHIAAAFVAAGLMAVAACAVTPQRDVAGSDPPVLHWYLSPDRVDAATLAKVCSTESDGAYTIRVEALPADAGARHNLLVRRLNAKDPSIDLIGLDDSATAEFAVDQLLAPIPDDLVGVYSKDVFPAALAAASYDGALVAAPWWLDPQLLWVRGSAAERAGLDLTTPLTWDDLLAGAARIGVNVDIDDHNGRGLADWVNALVADAGGTVVNGTGRRAQVGLGGSAAEVAAATVQFYAESTGGTGPSHDATTRFAGPDGGFLLAPSSVLSDPALATVVADMKWAAYPVIDSARPGVPPLAGVNLAVPLYAPHSDLSFDAITCLTSDRVMAALMSSAGHTAARASAFGAPGVAVSFPMAAAVKSALESGATVPQTPYWPLVRAGLQESWQPLSRVTATSTPRASQHAVVAALAGELP